MDEQRAKAQIAASLRESKERVRVVKPSPVPTQHWPPISGRYVTITDANETKKIVELPAFGEVTVISHGKEIRVETTVKEKVE